MEQQFLHDARNHEDLAGAHRRLTARLQIRARPLLHDVTANRACGLACGSAAKGMKRISYKGYRFPAEIIQQAIWLYLRFTLSFRDVEICWQNAALRLLMKQCAGG